LRSSGLAGLDIPGSAERLIATLFADDTTVFLSARDDYGDLLSILEAWCAAARAKFNGEKTEIIPVGPEEYRQAVRERRSIAEGGTPFPAGLRVAGDGEAVRTLGAWVGNRVDNAVPWHNVVAAIEENLTRWDKRNPTSQGRRLILNMEMGGRTQYLARVQGMPKSIEDRLEKLAVNFMWAGTRRPRVGKDTLMLPIQEG
ncbi:uncharacterized protein TRAVEDRAFT_108224, partial [Trametes versicolor FP-101664 SS1]|uniref:uncharacterized protein n=1 Tax=Trametes versicolor (strain FP-101664) TaxID=717944 RepID=UPI0004623E9B